MLDSVLCRLQSSVSSGQRSILRSLLPSSPVQDWTRRRPPCAVTCSACPPELTRQLDKCPQQGPHLLRLLEGVGAQ